MKARSWSTEVTEAALALFVEVITDPIDEIRGHFTAKILREWIKTNSIGLPAKKCVLYFNVEKRFVGAFLLSADDSFIYLPSGERVASIFFARTMDDELRGVFRSDNMVVLAL